MGENRIFTDDELKQMGAKTLDALLASVAQGNLDAASGLAKRMYGEFQAMHDLYRDWLTHTLSIIGRRYGDGVLSEVLEETVSAYTRRLSGRYAGKSARRKVEILAAGLRGHLQPLEIQEHDDHVSIAMPLCGSGGRLAREGAYDGPDGFLRIETPQPMTFGRADFPVYCAHCHFQNRAEAEPGGAPLFQTEPAQQVGEGACTLRIPK
jgi:hypothetical protein